MSTGAPPQTRKMSLAETLFNTAVGYAINQTAQILIFPMVGIHVPYAVNFALGVFFTAISIARGFCLRRFFEWWRIYTYRRTV